MSSISESREIKYSSRGRELQGPRPSPLRISNSSQTIKKSSHHQPTRSSKQLVNNPVVIYLRSPKIIHVRPEEFMSLVQRLTGKDSTNESCINLPSSPSSSSCDLVGDDESMQTTTKRDNLFDADQMMKTLNEVDFADQVLGLSPTWLRFLGCV
ncbi:VQ motif-containing protein 8, chloroplastic-like [Durio zibethinus]|uniref:VQ motif-containing protein 8, chloroplastic-like n=1 Tax=Durio zibethinus TaxID=66656 RepID=A0A6P5YWZ6_DURZI|nr:VQ motif-containing protein 8, chloroplastic-like [Durio zibethinus]